MIEIHNWEELSKLPPSKTHHIYIVKDESRSAYDSYYIESEKDIFYLSSHLFYGGLVTKEYEKLFKKCGFDVKIIA